MTARAPYPSSLRIAIVCPAPAGTHLGNRITALRWQRILEELGHEVVLDADASAPFDVLVALHATKSAAAIRESRSRFPSRPVVLALTGTDLYRDLASVPEARASVDRADRLVVLHDRAALDVPSEVRDRVRVVRQSADAPPHDVAKNEDAFEIAFVAHARPEKDPLRPALAARALPSSSRVRVVHAGRALSPEIETQLRREAAENPRYDWLGEVPPDDARALIARGRLLVLTSELEGGANVLGEAIVAGTPPIASRIPACVAALGDDYPGLFPVHDTDALARLFARAEGDRGFRDVLASRTLARRPLFAYAAERDAWRALLAELSTTASRTPT